MLSGRIDNFKNSQGAYLGADTRANPNDPVGGGEKATGSSLWVWRRLRVKRRAGPHLTASGGVTKARPVSGSADGVLWNAGQWNAQLYGPGDRDEVPEREAGIASTCSASERPDWCRRKLPGCHRLS